MEKAVCKVASNVFTTVWTKNCGFNVIRRRQFHLMCLQSKVVSNSSRSDCRYEGCTPQYLPRLPAVPSAVKNTCIRCYSSDEDNNKLFKFNFRRPIGVPVDPRIHYSPLRLLARERKFKVFKEKNRQYDTEFSKDQLTMGVKQAFFHMAQLLRESNFEDLEELFTDQALVKFKKKWDELPTEAYDIIRSFDFNIDEICTIFYDYFVEDREKNGEDVAVGFKVSTIAGAYIKDSSSFRLMRFSFVDFARQLSEKSDNPWIMTDIKQFDVLRQIISK